jgi:lipoprotein-releasing system permease protein
VPNLSYYIARRYLLSKNTISIITVMSLICMLVVALVTLAMVVILSAFNGIEDLIDDRYSYFDADLSVMPLNSKVIDCEELNQDSLAKMPGVASCLKVIEERVFAQYEGNQRIVIVKGVEPEFIQLAGMDTMMIDGQAALEIENSPAAIIGIGVKYDLDLRLFEQVFNPLRLSAIIRGKNLRRNMESALNRKSIPVNGIFSINIDFDSDYVIVPYDYASSLFEYENEYTALELNLKLDADIEEMEAMVQNAVGDQYEVRSRLEKNELIYKTNKTEKWATFVIMGFIMLIATFNIIAALTLLINEKRHDIKVLRSMGAPTSLIRRIFFIEGALINVVGAAFGLALGLIFVYLQSTYGLIRLQGGLVSYYPVAISTTDLIAIFALVLLCGLFSSIVPVQIFTRKYAKE